MTNTQRARLAWSIRTTGEIANELMSEAPSESETDVIFDVFDLLNEDRVGEFVTRWAQGEAPA